MNYIFSIIIISLKMKEGIHEYIPEDETQKRKQKRCVYFTYE